VCPCAAVFGGASISNLTADSVVELCARVPRFLEGQVFLTCLAVTWSKRAVCLCAAVFGEASILNLITDSVNKLCARVPRFLEGQVF
jgi:hypothetical protein